MSEIKQWTVTIGEQPPPYGVPWFFIGIALVAGVAITTVWKKYGGLK